jgi:hypothetical protein
MLEKALLILFRPLKGALQFLPFLKINCLSRSILAARPCAAIRVSKFCEFQHPANNPLPRMEKALPGPVARNKVNIDYR